MCDLITKPLTD